MFWPSRKRKTRAPHRKLLRLEQLERRQLLTVNILTNTPTTGALTITGDDFDNSITIQPSTNAATPNTFTIIAGQAANGKTTQLELNGVPVASPYVAGASGNLVTGNIAINLGTGQNSLLFGFTTAPTSPADPVQGNLTITDNASDTNQIENVDLVQDLTIVNAGVNNTVTNTITSVQIEGPATINNGGNTTTNISGSKLLDGLTATSPGATFVDESLTLNGCTVVGNVTVTNVAGGNTSTTVEGGWLEGLLDVDNGNGVNSLQIGSSTAATKIGNSPIPAAMPTAITVVNGVGGSFTQFVGENATSPLTVLGSIVVTNGASTAGALNMVTFTDADAAGRVAVTNGGTPANPSIGNGVSVQDSNLGMSELTAATPNPVTIENGTGYDSFSMTSVNAACTAPWGVLIDNTDGGANLNASTVWGSSTNITGSSNGGTSIGTGVFGPNDGIAGDGFDLTGDNGNDIVTVSSATINGVANLNLNGGSNQVTLQQKTQLAVLNVTTGGTAANHGISGNDSVSINTTNITNGLALDMGGLTNSVSIIAGTTTGWGTLPNPSFYPITITANATVPISQNTLSITTSLFDTIPDGDITDYTLMLM
jgi:hypothetical protein